MGGPASLTLRHIAPMRERAEDTCNKVKAELDRLEAKYSRYVEGSVISEINRNAGSGTVTKIDDETRGLLHVCSQLYEQSDDLIASQKQIPASAAPQIAARPYPARTR